MPEIAEVAVYANDISKIICNKVLSKVSFKGEARWRDVIVPSDVRKILESWLGQSLTLNSLAKTLYLASQENNEHQIQFKLGMTGMFQIKDVSETQINKHAFIVFEFDSEKEKTVLYYMDFRRFGRVSQSKEEPFAVAGFNNDKGFFVKSRDEITHLLTHLKGFDRKPKISWLLEYGVKTGVGNYLANEALGFLNLSPFTPCANKEEAIDLLVSVADIAAKSFKSGGNSFKGGYYRLTGELGNFAEHCMFYRNQNIHCFNFRGRPVYTTFEPPKGIKGLK